MRWEVASVQPGAARPSPSGQIIYILSGEQGYIDPIDDHVLAELAPDGPPVTNHTVDEDGNVALTVDPTDLCCTFTMNDIDRSFDIYVQLAAGEIIHEALERADACE